ncbi:MAG: hypothetical protein ABR569_08970 [Gaiellaceae bacterium]
MAAAWIGFAAGVFAALVSAIVAIRQAQANQRLERLKTDLSAELHRREARIDQEFRAEDVLARYREPLAVAAFDLQSRLYNILRLDFLGKFGGTHARSEVALRTTLFRLAQYFGWTEILRRDIQFLSFPEAEHTRQVANLQSDIAREFLRDDYGPAMMIWADEQRAIGELMIVEEHGRILSMGFAAFERRCDELFTPWLDQLRAELPQTEATKRLRQIQHLLCTLVETLDVHRVRYEQELERA